MCAKTADICVIAVNSSMSKGRQRFTLAHELYHFKYESENSISICSMKFSAATDDGIEQDADRFASYLLLPPGSFEDKVEEVKKKHSTLSKRI
jgi:Zn-dependent peptidase ImmA (M78 family)